MHSSTVDLRGCGLINDFFKSPRLLSGKMGAIENSPIATDKDPV